MSLIDDIQAAQTKAAEDVVCDNLDKLGLGVNDLDKLTQAFKAIGIEHTVRKYKGTANNIYSYVFVGDPRNIHCPDDDFKTTDLDQLTARYSFFEFENSELASYSNS